MHAVAIETLDNHPTRLAIDPGKIRVRRMGTNRPKFSLESDGLDGSRVDMQYRHPSILGRGNHGAAARTAPEKKGPMLQRDVSIGLQPHEDLTF
jgi:hypothetical protein